MRSNRECWHGFLLAEEAVPDRPGLVRGRAPDCALCAAEGWTTVAYEPAPKALPVVEAAQAPPAAPP